MASPSPSVAPSNPRKFAEKIALHTQKGAEETAEFKKIMAECMSVKASRVILMANILKQIYEAVMKYNNN